nr:MAG TPA: Triple QxxK/R motif-containing protein family [Caudoviricetes sp.]
MVINIKNKKKIKQIDNQEELKKNTIKVLDLILIIVGISTFIFTVIMLIFFYLFQSIPDTLCERFFTVIVGELGITGIIKIVKIIFKNKNISEIISENENEYNDLDNEEEIDND